MMCKQAYNRLLPQKNKTFAHAGRFLFLVGIVFVFNASLFSLCSDVSFKTHPFFHLIRKQPPDFSGSWGVYIRPRTAQRIHASAILFRRLPNHS
jgi:hypothetical protein